jgi:hypothetical protein
MLNPHYWTKSVRSAAILTTSYVAGTVIGLSGDSGVDNCSQLSVLIDFTIGSLTSAEVKVEFSDDGVTYYQESFSSVSSGTDTLTLGEHKLAATGKFYLSIPFQSSYVKISAKGTGTVTSSSMAISASVGVV